MSIKPKYLFVLILILLLLPEIGFAFWGGFFDYFKKISGLVEEKAGPISAFLIQMIIIYLLALISLSFTASLLNRAILGSQELLTIQDNLLIARGWDFTAGLANLFIILILLAIAYAFIFKIETYGLKKALPRLIIVALLLNFSLLFVAILVDISNILFNTFLPRGGVGAIINPLQDRMLAGLGSMTANISVMVASYLIPFVGPFTQFALVATWLAAFHTTLLVWVFQVVIAFILSGVFLIFAILFIVRAFLVWILAILAPLAFICLILPATQKYWTLWFKTLLEWLLLGVILLFLMVLGMGVGEQIVPKETPGVVETVVGWFILDQYVLYYIFLAIYFAVTAFIVKKFMPQGAQAMIDQGKALIAPGGPLTKMGSLALGALKTQAAQQAQKGEEAEERQEKQEESGKTLTFGQKVGIGAARAMGFASSLGFRAAGTDYKAHLEKEELKKKEGVDEEMKGLSGDAKADSLLSERSDKKRQFIIENMIENEDVSDIQKLIDLGKIDKDKMLEVAEKMGRTRLINAAFPILSSQRSGETLDDAVSKIKNPNLKFISNTDIKNNLFIETSLKTFSAERMNSLIAAKGEIAVNSIRDCLSQQADPRDYIENVLKNPGLINYFEEGQGQRLFGHIVPTPTTPPPITTPPPTTTPPPGWKPGPGGMWVPPP
ncbi:MAG: hypothetical protein KY055_00605 [Candidatus Nealsonbacteria bacterium]|nr:hypothetical protein [Candidatus Nealsonbacteria bacterium]